MAVSRTLKAHYDKVVLSIATVAVLHIASLYSYLLFHTLAEFFSISVAVGIFLIMWNSRRFIDNNYLLFVGISFLFVGGLDLLHTLAYKGMGVFTGYDANLPTQFWISARYMEALTVLISPLFLTRRLNVRAALATYTSVTMVVVASIFSGLFPDCFVEGKGLTNFKILSEYAISLILAASLLMLWRRRQRFDAGILRLVSASIALTIGAEFSFTKYVSVYGFANEAGHFLKIGAFYLIYKAMIETGLQKPYSLLFRSLKQSEETLKRQKEELEEALKNVKTLKGLLPMCAWCKNVRDDKGYWTQVEKYISEHSEAEFTHGICPECLQKIEPDFYK